MTSGSAESFGFFLSWLMSILQFYRTQNEADTLAQAAAIRKSPPALPLHFRIPALHPFVDVFLEFARVDFHWIEFELPHPLRQLLARNVAARGNAPAFLRHQF